VLICVNLWQSFLNQAAEGGAAIRGKIFPILSAAKDLVAIILSVAKNHSIYASLQ
jgi:hypothetical protein